MDNHQNKNGYDFKDDTTTEVNNCHCCNHNQLVPPHTQYPAQGFATTSLILSLLSIPLLCAYGVGFVLAIVALILAVISRSRGNRSGVSLAGLVMSTVSIATTIVLIWIIVISGTASFLELPLLGR